MYHPDARIHVRFHASLQVEGSVQKDITTLVAIITPGMDFLETRDVISVLYTSADIGYGPDYKLYTALLEVVERLANTFNLADMSRVARSLGLLMDGMLPEEQVT